MKFIITVDTEADNQWKRSPVFSLKNILHLPRFQKLCESFGFIPTYLVTHEVAVDPVSVAVLKPWSDAKRAEIGAHLHPWSNPPYEQNSVLSNGEIAHPFPSELPLDILKAKLIELTRVIKVGFGISPTSYRAGRWGMDYRQAKILRSLGYFVDCSITPKVNWQGNKGGKGGPNWQKESVRPSVMFGGVEEGGEKFKGIFEAPMTILHTGILNRENSWFNRHISAMEDSFLKKVLNKLFFRLTWLRVFKESKEADWLRIYESAKKNNLPVLEFMIHSSELMPGGSPYAKTSEEVERLYDQLRRMFTLLKAKGVEGVSLSDFARGYHD